MVQLNIVIIFWIIRNEKIKIDYICINLNLILLWLQKIKLITDKCLVIYKKKLFKLQMFKKQQYNNSQKKWVIIKANLIQFCLLLK